MSNRSYATVAARWFPGRLDLTKKATAKARRHCRLHLAVSGPRAKSYDARLQGGLRPFAYKVSFRTMKKPGDSWKPSFRLTASMGTFLSSLFVLIVCAP